MYFDLDDILAESQKLTGNFQMEVDNLGFLMNNTNNAKITPREKLELPFWLITALTFITIHEESKGTTRNIFSVERPEYLSKLASNFYKASPLNADLSVVSHFYKIVQKWCDFIEQPELVDIVSDMLILRAGKINDLSFNISDSQSRENMEFLQTLDNHEKGILKVTSESYNDFKTWLNSK